MIDCSMGFAIDGHSHRREGIVHQAGQLRRGVIRNQFIHSNNRRSQINDQRVSEHLCRGQPCNIGCRDSDIITSFADWKKAVIRQLPRTISHVSRRLVLPRHRHPNTRGGFINSATQTRCLISGFKTIQPKLRNGCINIQCQLT